MLVKKAIRVTKVTPVKTEKTVLMERMEKSHTGPKRIYLLANMGLYESAQLTNLFSAVKQWCSKAGYEYCGGLGVSAGELMGTLMEVVPFRRGTTKKASQGMDRLVRAIDNAEAAGDKRH